MYFYHFLIILIILLLSAKTLAWLFKKLDIPPVLGELCAGIILGPSLLGFIQADNILELLAEVGVVFLLFEVGLHTDIARLLATGRKPFIVASIGFILPLFLGFMLARYFDFSILSALFIGGTLSATSIGITLRVLTDLHKHKTHEAQIVLGAAIVDDIFGVLLLSLLYTFTVTGVVSVFAVIKLALSIIIFMWLAPLLAKLGFWLLDYLLPKSIFKALLLTFTLLLILLFSILAHAIGAPTIIGGFVAGIALSRQFNLQFKLGSHTKLLRLFNEILKADNPYFELLDKQIKPFLEVFTPIFFVMVGVALNFRIINTSSTAFWLLSIGLLFVALVSKFASGFFIRESKKTQALIGVAMIPRGEVGLIFASMGLSSGILNTELYASLVLVVALSTFLPPFLLKYLYR